MQVKQLNTLSDKTDILIPFFKDSIDLELISDLTGIQNPDFEGNFKESVKLYGNQGNRVFLLGLGEKKDAKRSHEAFKSFAFKNKENWPSNLQIICGHLNEIVSNAILGIQLATYDIGLLKSEEQRNKLVSNEFEVGIFGFHTDEKLLNTAIQTGESINRMKGLIDTPSNIKTPDYLASWAKSSAETYGYECEVLEKKELKKKGLHALLAVGQGSINEPRLIICSHNPQNKTVPDIALIGKGITFDTGGLSMKPAQNMHYMKSDMGGAAVVLGTVELAARLNLPIHLVGVVASAENSVDANSIRPGDVIQSYAGKSIEVIDTDAEGRLVLADAISYVLKNYKSKQMIDLATLTGSVVRTFGYTAAGMFTNNEEMAELLSELGEKTHERVWRLPLYEDYEEDLHSDVADLRNFSNKPIAGAINAAKFLEYFTESHDHWAHLDIAGVSLGDSEYAKMKSATGYGVRLLTEYLKTLE